MPTQVEQKVVDPESELSNALRRFQQLAPKCSIEKKALGNPQLATQEKQMAILKHEMTETALCIRLAKKGQHGIRDAVLKKNIPHAIVEYEGLTKEVKSQEAQQSELELLNYLSKKLIAALKKTIPTENYELQHLEQAHNRLRRMENRLDLATKRFCLVNSENTAIREAIHLLLVERKTFNIQWNRTIANLMKGKEYLMDIMEIAQQAFANRDNASRILETLKWKGLYQLNKDIAEMQYYDGELNHLAKLEEYLRVKGSKRLCEADEKEEMKRLDEIARCEEEIIKLDALLDEIFAFAGTSNVLTIIRRFQKTEIENFSMFVLLCEVLQEYIFLKKNVDSLRQIVLDYHDINDAREERQVKRIIKMSAELAAQQQRTQEKVHQNMVAEALYSKILNGINDLFRIAKCDNTPLLTLLGNHLEVNHWNAPKFLKIMEIEVKSLIEVVYGAVKPPAPTPKGKAAAERPVAAPTKLIADPYVETVRPNLIESLVPYQPCAYCVEDYMMNQVFETPAVIADKDYIDSIFKLEDVNTKFEIFTLTIPGKRHPFRNKGGDKNE